MSETPENLSTDVLIVGGGIIGLCTAYYLQQQGVSVMVVDQGAMGEGSSFANAGLVAPSHFIPLASPGVIRKGLRWMLNPESPFYIKPRLDVDLFSWLWKFRHYATSAYVNRHKKPLKEFLEYSYQLFEALHQSNAFDFEWTPHGLLMVYLTEGGRRDLEYLHQQAGELEVPAEWVSAERLPKFLGHISTTARGGLFFPGDAHLDPGKFVKGMADFLSRKGVRLLEHTAVRDFRVQGNRVEAVVVNDVEIRASRVVVTAGSWTAALVARLGIRLPLQPAKGYSITFPWEKPRFTVPLILTETKIAVTPFRQQLRFAGTLELAGLQLNINSRRVRAIRKGVQRYLPDIGASETSRGTIWAGLRPCTPDGLPVVGRVPNFSNLWLATGHAMIGISLATGTGKAIADDILGKTPEIDLQPFRVDRFQPRLCISLRMTRIKTNKPR
ncbi:MAG: FAD-dependent oxidoreductase [Calditrichaeota bacterium]|nr:FAD-dependent oxidoreductase [Calditrichota bacterium]